MTEKMKTVCVGRFLVDVPNEADVSLSREMMDGFEIDRTDESEMAFRERVTAREAAIRNPDAHAGTRSGGMVEARDLRTPDMIGRILIFGRTRSYSMEDGRRVDDEWVSIEAHAHKEGVSFSLSMKYADQSDAQAAEALLARLRLRHENEIPSVPGFCIDRAVFAEPLPPHKTEHIVMHVGFLDHPDVALAFASMPGGGRDRTLLARYADMDAEAGPDELLRVTKLRTGKRDINALAGEEVLERVREFNFATTYGFMWETQGVKDDPLQPFLSLELHGGISPRPGGKPADTSLHEDAVLDLWNRISSSIRPRPAGPPTGVAPPAEPPGPQRGAVATAGQPCPQAGWWKCSEGGPGVDVQGGAVQWVRKGERMPQALLLPRQTLWQKMRGIQASIEPDQPTTWTLVDKRARARTARVVALAQPGPVAAVAETAGTDGRAATVGTLARTGETCPASGWWRCEEVQALDGTRWFPRGGALPTATFQVPAGMFGRAAGPDVIQRRSTWQLVRRAEAEGVAPSVPLGQAPQGEPAAPATGPSTLA
jgi:hypothetical protein